MPLLFGSVAARPAASGYSALAIDLLSEEGGTGSFPDEAAAMAALYAVPTDRFVADLKAGVAELRGRLPGKKVAAIGFRFGGAMVWDAARGERAEARGSRPVLGTVPRGRVAEGLGGRGARRLRGARRPRQRDQAGRPRGLARGGRAAPARHVPRRRYDRAAAEAAYGRVLAWFKRYVG